MWVVSVIPARRKVGTSQRETCHEPRPRRLDDEGRRLARHLAEQGRTLREIAAEVGVSHETVRIILRQDSASAVA
jgi:hypothetical protein